MRKPKCYWVAVMDGTLGKSGQDDQSPCGDKDCKECKKIYASANRRGKYRLRKPTQLVIRNKDRTDWVGFAGYGHAYLNVFTYNGGDKFCIDTPFKARKVAKFMNAWADWKSSQKRRR